MTPTPSFPFADACGWRARKGWRSPARKRQAAGSGPGTFTNRRRTPSFTHFGLSDGATSERSWYLADSGGGGFIRVMGTNGRDMRMPAYGYDPSWSPDGRRIAFASRLDDPDVLAIYVVGTAGGDPKWLAAGDFPSW